MLLEEEIPAKLVSFISTRDRRAATVFGYHKTPHADAFARMLRGDTVRIGGRASCGAKADPSWVEFTDWNAIVRKARSLGLAIEETPVKHGNGWATKAGGFWNENDYRLKKD